MHDVRLSAAQWREVCERVFKAWGAPDDSAACVAHSLVESNLAGVDSHGVVRIGNYYNFVKPGWWLPASRPQVVREGSCTAVVDGHWGFGQPAMHVGRRWHWRCRFGLGADHAHCGRVAGQPD
jgi:LDH2 family malate/lactate/ureidoglycolate dehydrogenase